jgi:Spy/CpxP family protein refolding chaperone
MKKFFIICTLFGLFVLGALCGIGLAFPFAKKLLSEDHFVKQRMAEEVKRLKLTPEQVEKSKPIYDQLRQDLAKIKIDTLTSIAQASIRQSTELAGLLTPEQTEEYKKLGDERRVNFEKFMKP